MLLSHAISACEGLSFCWFSAWNQLLGAVGASAGGPGEEGPSSVI